MKFGWNKRLTTALLGVVGFFGLLAPASAVIVTTNYDPDFGSGLLSGYGWRATVNYEIPKSCFDLGGPGAFKVGSLVFGCSPNPFTGITDPFKVMTAEVGLYAVGNPNDLLDVLTFDAGTLPLALVCLDQTIPKGVSCAISGVASVTLFSVNYTQAWSDTQTGNAMFEDFNFRMTLLGDAVLQYQHCPGATENCTAAWTTAPSPKATESYINTDPDWRENTRLRVPEPGSAALVLLALGAGLATTRRR